jgi:predicted trehalose synthase
MPKGYEDESDAAMSAAWADEVQRRSRELEDGSVRGLSVEEARRMVASDPADDDR